MADLDLPEPDTTGTADYDHDFERVDADDRGLGNEYPEEDSYDPDDQPESSQFPAEEPSSTIPTADLLSFGGAGDEQGEPEDEGISPANDPAHGHNIDEDLLGGFAPAANTEPESSAASAGDLIQTEKEVDTSPQESSLLHEQPAEPTSTSDTDKAASPSPGKSLGTLLGLLASPCAMTLQVAHRPNVRPSTTVVYVEYDAPI